MLALTEMKKAGIIETGRECIIILDRDRLQRAAESGL